MAVLFTNYLKLVLLYSCLHLMVSGTIQSNCKIGHLDNVSFAQCGNTGYAMRCNDTRLEHIPDSYPKPENLTEFPPPLCLLDLSYNIFTNVSNNSFVNKQNLNSTDVLWLYLDYSQISYIEPDAFTNLTNLLYLNLTGNNLYEPWSFGDGVFKPLVNLRDINVKEIKFTTFVDIGKELQYLKKLKGLYIDLCDNCIFGEDFSKLTNLTNLSLSGRTEKACNAPTLTGTTFKYVPTVQRLYLASCHIRSIENTTFSHLKNLSHLDISYNEELTFTGMNKALFGLRNSSTLKILNVNRIHTLYESGIRLKLSDIENLKTLRALETLHMDMNKIEVFDEEIFNPYQFPHSLLDLTLSGNRLTYGKYIQSLQNIIGLKSIDLSRQHLNYDPFFHEHYESQRLFSEIAVPHVLAAGDKCSFPCAVCLPKSIQRVKWRKSFIYLKLIVPFAVCGAIELNHLDLSFNLISKWNATVFGVENVLHLDLSENTCDEVDPTFFLKFVSLKHLNISVNNLGEALDPEINPRACKMFQFLKNLTRLDISFNKLSRVPEDLLAYQTNLQYLNLSDNNFGEWNLSLKNSKCLRNLDLSGNKLYQLPESLTSHLDSIVESECNKNVTVMVKLYYNPIECSCKTLPFLKWLRYSKVKVKFLASDICRLNGQNYQIRSNEHMEEIIDILENDKCLDRSWITWTISASCSLLVGILSIIVCCAMYRNRWKLRYLYFSRNRRFIHKGFEHLFDNDAFVSYTKNNASFIKNEMVPWLEEEHKLRLWVADRNSLPGTSIAENISHGIYTSRKSILLINKDYVDETWCDYEMNMALTESVETKRKLLIIVLMEPIPMGSLPVHIMRLLQSERSLEYPEHHQDLSTFWSNLADEINSDHAD